jgi:hypothetical protein
MHVSLSRHRPPTGFERLVGRRRATRLRRRAGFAAIGAGVMLLRPRSLLAPALAVVLAATIGTVLVVAVT